MSAVLMDPAISAALQAGRSVIVPSPQRASALRWNWARLQRTQGREVWSTPEILTWDAWLARQWQSALQAGRVNPELRRLSRSQERRVWGQVLDELGPRFDAADELHRHAPALMQAAARASQSLLTLAKSAVAEEELLLVEALQEFRQICARQSCISLALAPPEQLAAWIAGPAPLLAGVREATPLQMRLAEMCWPGQTLMAPEPSAPSVIPRRVRAQDPLSEIEACAAWCRQLLQEDGSRRLLVVSASVSPSLAAQGLMLSRALLRDSTAELSGEADAALLVIEGGMPLLRHRLVADALAALQLREEISADELGQLLCSRYLQFGSEDESQKLERALRETGVARWPRVVLRDLLQQWTSDYPAAEGLLRWLDVCGEQGQSARQTALEWARRFDLCLSAAGFLRRGSLDSREAQRVARWSALLDEFAAFDAVPALLEPVNAVEELRGLAAQATHEAVSGDVAITVSSHLGDPLASYDGIWVLGLSEQQWPEPPRPDPYVALAEQRRCNWEASGARQRLEQARWAQRRWALRTGRLVLSYAQQVGDLRHRPSVLLAHADGEWQDILENPATGDFCQATPESDPVLPALAPHHSGLLSQGLRRLQLQQGCAFRSQAEVRLGAEVLPATTAGIDRRGRGILLHGLFEGAWQELGRHEALLALTPSTREALFERHWITALRRLRRSPVGVWIAPRVLERERLRAAHLFERVLEMEATRPAFRVVSHEQALQLTSPAGAIGLRIDRVDEDVNGRRLLIDYKSGRGEPVRLGQGIAQPLQLALYARAMAQQGGPVQAAALLTLSPAETGYLGVALDREGLPGRWQALPDWEQLYAQWQAEIDSLLDEHLRGSAEVAPLPGVCRYCHLAGLCRRDEESMALAESAGDASLTGSGDE